MGISDLIASFLMEGLEEAEDGVLEVQRSDLAQRFNCVPSQINYVMSTRFSPEHGYIVESRRGGGGYVRIRKVAMDRDRYLMHFYQSISDGIDVDSARYFLEELAKKEILTPREAKIVFASLSNGALKNVKKATQEHMAKMMQQGGGGMPGIFGK